MSYYDEKTLSVLLQDETRGNPVLAQLPIAAVDTNWFTNVPHGTSNIFLSELQCHNVGDQIDPLACRSLENMKALSFAVSGSRKVAAVLFSSRRRCRVFLMDAEDDDDEDTMFESTCNETGPNECKATDKSDSEAWTLAPEAADNSTAEGDSLGADDEDKENTSIMEME